MIEALVSIVVLSIGLLGVAALQGVGLRASSSAAYRSQAAWFAAQMIEEARSNRAGVRANDSGLVGAVAAQACTTPVATTPIQTWRIRVACALPGGAGGVTYNTFTQRLQVTVEWNDQRGIDNAASGGAAAASFTIETVL